MTTTEALKMARDALADLHMNVTEAMQTGGWVPTPLHASFWHSMTESAAAIAAIDALPSAPSGEPAATASVAGLADPPVLDWPQMLLLINAYAGHVADAAQHQAASRADISHAAALKALTDIRVAMAAHTSRWQALVHELIWRAAPQAAHTAAAPQAQAVRAPLTDEKIDAMRQGAARLNFVTLREFRVIARAVEAAHGITAATSQQGE